MGLGKLFGGAGKSLVDSATGLIDTLTTSDDEKSSAKAKLTEIITSSLTQIASYQRDIIVQEMKGNWLQRSWRPVMMLTFGVILVCKWFGWTDTSIPVELEIQLLDIVKFGLGGYLVGRSVEKIATNVTQNIDLPFLKKKDRKDIVS